MKSALTLLAVLAAMSALAELHASPGPLAAAPTASIAVPKDRPFAGQIELSVDATDVSRRIIHVHESVSGLSGESLLLYPKWLPGTHAPEGPLDRLAGIKISVNGQPLPWTRDVIEMYAFHVHLPGGARSIVIDFDYLSPTSAQVGVTEITPEMMMLEWNALLLYPAGYYARQIPVIARVTIPEGWQLATALEGDTSSANHASFRRTNLGTLIDSPIYAGRYVSRLDLDPGSDKPVRMDLFADRPSLLNVKPEQLQAYRSLVSQSYRVFGPPHYAHYDFLYSLSDQLEEAGLEHHQSSEDGSDPESFTEWDKTAYVRDLLAHELAHSWNGKFRRPADLWTPSYEVPMRNTLLWMYEGQTQYWGHVLAGRAGLRTREQSLDQFAIIAAEFASLPGRGWRALQDTTHDEIINPRRPQSWQDYQRFEDYYNEGALIWLDADTLIREKSLGKRSLDDFAREFFGVNPGSMVPVTYTFQDIVRALNAIEPYDWSNFLRRRLDATGTPGPLEGIRRGGYELVFTDTPSEYQKLTAEQRSRIDLYYSIGIVIDAKNKEGRIRQVRWDSAAYAAKLTESAQILAVNGVAYTAETLRDAIRAAAGTQMPIELIVKTADHFRVVHVNYHDGLRYPHLVRNPQVPARLDDILTPRQ